MKTMNRHNTMKKRLITLIFTILMTVSSAMAQVFIMEDDGALNARDPEGGIVFNVMVNSQDVSNDQFVPLGSGIAVLAALGGAYLLGKRRKEE